MIIYKRLPPLTQIASLYAIIVLVIYTWTILWSFWKLPSWLNFLSIGEILTIYAYSLTTNLLESLLVLCLPLGLSLILPCKWSSEAFVTRGIVVALSNLGYVTFILIQSQSLDNYPANIVRLVPVVFLASLILSFLIGKVKLLVKTIDFFAEQAIVFLYITIPLSLVSLIVVLTRLLF